MAVEQHESASPVVRNPREETALARLREVLDGAPGELYLGTPDGTSVLIPTSLRRVLRVAAQMLAREKAVALEPAHEISAAQAAAFLRVSEEHLGKLLDEGELPFRRVGEEQCIELNALYAYDERRHKLNRQALREMTRIAEESPGGYD